MIKQFQLIVFVLLITGCTPAIQINCTSTTSIDHLVSGKGTCLAIKTYGAERTSKVNTLVVFLHGDLSAGGSADYIAKYAQALANERSDIVAIAIARPGYGFGDGSNSGGYDNGRRDHYTQTNVDILADALTTLKSWYTPQKLVLVGHSGGAALAGNIAGLHPGLLDGAVLVSCPCDIPRWRSSNGATAWSWSSSLSPIACVDKVAPNFTVTAITGSSDTNTSTGLARDYVKALSSRGIKATFIEVTGAGHNWTSDFWDGGIHDAIRAMLF